MSGRNVVLSLNQFMSTINIKLTNSLISENLPRPNRTPTIYIRTLKHLIALGRHPGRIIPVYLKILNDFKVLGAFTLNKNGSVSFFPDLAELDLFDHLTVDKNFISKGGHFTTLDSKNKHRKYMSFDITRLDSGDYHIITFVIPNGDLLMDVPSSIDFPSVLVDDHRENEYMSILQEAIQNDTYIITFPENTEGLYCVQILYVSNSKQESDIAIWTNIIQKFTKNIKDLENPIYAKKAIIPLPGMDFSVSITAFRFPGIENSPMYIGVAKKTS